MSEVAVTGVGVVSAFGLGVAANEQAWLDGRAALEPAFPGASVSVGRVRGLDTASILPDPRQIQTMSENAELICWAGLMALRDAGIEPRSEVLINAGLFIGFWYERRTLEDYLSIARASIDRHTKEFDTAKMLRVGLKSQPPYTLLRSLASVGAISIQAGIKGPNLALGTTPITGGQAVCAGLDAIRCGDADLALVGAADYQTDVLAVAEHAYLGPQHAPDDVDIGPGDSAAMLVLESPAAAVAAGRRIHGFVLGYGECYLPHTDPTAKAAADGMARAIAVCLADCTDESVRIDSVLYDDVIERNQMERALATAGLDVAAAAIKPGTHLAGDMLSAALPWMSVMALTSTALGRCTLICAYGVSGHYCALLVRKAS